MVRWEKNRRSLRTWSINNRVIDGIPFALNPPLEGLYACREPRIVVRKAAQVMISEWLINVALYVADTQQGGRGNSVYIFPHEKQLGDFVRGRIDKAVDQSPTLPQRVRGNVGWKKVGRGQLYLRGASKRQMVISVDADCVLCDEISEYSLGTIDTLERRLGSSTLGWLRAASTPRYPADEAGKLWESSTQGRYEVRCHRCKHWQALDVTTHLRPETGTIECEHCHKDMTADRLSEGHWEEVHPQRDWKGFHLSKLYSTRASLADLSAKYLAVLEGRAGISETQEFYNSDAARPYLPEGGHLNDDDLDACVERGYELPTDGEHCVMGVDVGSRLHIRIDQPGLRTRLVYADSVKSFDELDNLMVRYDIDKCVIDANPETRKAEEFAERHAGRVWLAYYVGGDGKPADLVEWDRSKRHVRIHRTGALDRVIDRVKRRQVMYPRNARELGGGVDKTGKGEFYRHMGSPVRVTEVGKDGNAISRYEQNGPDHLGHADLYCLIAQSRKEPGVAQYEPQIAPELANLTYEDQLPLVPNHKARLQPEDIDPEEVEAYDLPKLMAMHTAAKPVPLPQPPLDLSEALIIK